MAEILGGNQMIELITLEELAKITGKTKFELAILCTEGKIPHTMKDGMPRFDPAKIFNAKHIHPEQITKDNANQ